MLDAIAAPDHLAQLLERHEVSVAVPPGLTVRERDIVWHRCALVAEAWLVEQGLAVVLNYFHHDGEDTDGELCAGVWFDVVVGKATQPPALPADPHPELEWTWSARWQHWRGWFNSMAVKERAEARAAVGTDESTVVSMASYGATPPWDRHR